MDKISAPGNMPLTSQNAERFSQVNLKTPENLAQVKKLSEEFEAVFLEIVLKSMRESVQKSDLTNGGNGEQIFQSMLDSEYSKNLATYQSTGLASTIMESLTQRMGDVPVPAPTEDLAKAAGLAKYGEAVKNKP